MMITSRYGTLGLLIGLVACDGGTGPTGPSGAQGPAGSTGPAGTMGDQGVNCYDGLSDLNGDGVVDVLDCRASAGTVGVSVIGGVTGPLLPGQRTGGFTVECDAGAVAIAGGWSAFGATNIPWVRESFPVPINARRWQFEFANPSTSGSSIAVNYYVTCLATG